MKYPIRRAALAALLAPLVLVPLVLGGCASPGGGTPAQQNLLWQESDSAIARFKARDPSMQRFFDTARGYAVFPSVGKGGLWVGGAHGQGTVYEGDALVGHASLTQITVGLQAGAQAYQEVIFFETDAALRRFKRSGYEVAAQVGGVVVVVGASTTAQYQNGVAIFTLPRGGLMYEATVGGQKFAFRPLTATAQTAPPTPALLVETTREPTLLPTPELTLAPTSASASASGSEAPAALPEGSFPPPPVPPPAHGPLEDIPPASMPD